MGARASLAGFTAAVCAATVTTGIASAEPALAETLPSVVITEVMYHPAEDPKPDDDLDNLEFIEIHNPGATPVSLARLRWDAGVKGELPDIELAGGAFAILSPDSGATSAAYGVTPIGTYEEKLSNGGETLRLVDGDGSVVDEVDFDDRAPWPEAADGAGSSIELVDPTGDNSAAETWRPSIVGGTPGAGPVAREVAIADVSMTPTSPGSSDEVTIEATMTGVDEAELVYRVGFGRDRRMDMTRTGSVFTARIPAQDGGDLVRYRIETAAGVTHPPEETGRRFDGYVVGSSRPDTDIPHVQWFIEDDDFDTMLGDSLFDRDRLFPAVIAVDGYVIDAVRVQVRGGDYARTNHPKQSYNVELPDGTVLDAPELFDYPVDEFALQAEYSDRSKGRAAAAWHLFALEGFAPVASQYVQVDRNGEFFGLFRVSEKLDGRWREAHGFDDSNFYKADGGWRYSSGFDQKEGDPDDRSVAAARDVVLSDSSSAKRRQLYDTFDVPNIVNYMALSMVLMHSDQLSHNYYVAHDLDGTGRVSLHPWDLDLTWAFSIGRCRGDELADLSCLRDSLFDSFWDVPEIRAAVYRRVRSILDGSLGDDTIEAAHRNLVAQIGPVIDDLELDAWPRASIVDHVSRFERWVQNRRDVFESVSSVPRTQPSTPRVVISEIHYNPADDGPEFLELVNLEPTAIDLSGWRIDGVDLDVPFGAVIPARGRVVVTDDDRAFRAAHPGLEVVVIEYRGGLKNSGETITLADASGRPIDVVPYDDEAPWPTEPDDGQVSLELLDPDSDNSNAAAWAPSSSIGGTPGRGPVGAPPLGTSVMIRARGTTGDEKLELRSDGTVLATVELSETMSSHVVELDDASALEDLQIAFVNDGRSGGKDRNVQIDYVEIGKQRVQSEDPSVRSLGSWAGGSCGLGFKRSEYLHCNGYFDFSGLFGSASEPPASEPPASEPPVSEPPGSEPPGSEPPGSEPPGSEPPGSEPPVFEPPVVDPPVGSVSEVEVLAVGQAGGERIQLVIDGVVVGEWTLDREPDFYRSGISFQRFAYTHPTGLSGADVRVEFVNDGRTGGEDRNVRIDAVVIDGQRFESEHSAVSSKGVWRNGARCRLGEWLSEYLHCNGYFDYVNR